MPAMDADLIQLAFDAGTIVVSGAASDRLLDLPGVRFDSRTNAHRAEARCYRAIVEHLRSSKTKYTDDARNFQPTPWPLKMEREPFPHQTEAVDTWWREQGRGVVVLPTGTGKTYMAILAISKAARPALIVTPTIDLLNQWYGELSQVFGVSIGLMGGGHHDLQPITVTTYDSAYIYVEKWGNRFGLLVFDECHHLPGPTSQIAAIASIAPFRLGLTATPERADGLDSLYPVLIGPVVYRREIKQLAGDFLAEFTTERLYVDLSAEELERYNLCRETYKRFLFDRGISLASGNGLQRFIAESCRSTEGRQAFLAFREQRRLAQAAPAKIETLTKLLARHRGQRTLIFTADNATVYRIARQFLIPAITHQTKAKERRAILQRFHAGDYTALVTSQVLNEGVDVPAAGVGIVLSGTGSVREHVQRLGRLLRKFEGKQAVLYEVVARGTVEEFTSERRRQHHAYQQ
jgi:superfamily II DNA or RNA helicase